MKPVEYFVCYNILDNDFYKLNFVTNNVNIDIKYIFIEINNIRYYCNNNPKELFNVYVSVFMFKNTNIKFGWGVDPETDKSLHYKLYKKVY